MKLLLTNDDGFEAPGLAALLDAVADLGDATIAAPAVEQSGKSHTVTTHQPFRIIQHRPKLWAVEGTPADCVRATLVRVVPDVDCVLSGINAGGNLGADVFHSGTVAAAREATLHGVLAIAVSHYKKRELDYDWPRATRWTAEVLRELLQLPREEGLFWNVNLPNLRADEPEPPVVYCPLDTSPLPLEFHIDDNTLAYNSNYHQRRRQRGSDVDVCFDGAIAVTPLRLA